MWVLQIDLGAANVAVCSSQGGQCAGVVTGQILQSVGAITICVCVSHRDPVGLREGVGQGQNHLVALDGNRVDRIVHPFSGHRESVRAQVNAGIKRFLVFDADLTVCDVATDWVFKGQRCSVVHHHTQFVRQGAVARRIRHLRTELVIAVGQTAQTSARQVSPIAAAQLLLVHHRAARLLTRQAEAKGVVSGDAVTA